MVFSSFDIRATWPELVLHRVEIARHGLWGGERCKVVDDPLVHRVPKHRLHNLPQDGDHLPSKPDVLVLQIEDLVDEQQGDAEGDVVVVGLDAGAHLRVVRLHLYIFVLERERLRDPIEGIVNVPDDIARHRRDRAAHVLDRPLDVVADRRHRSLHHVLLVCFPTGRQESEHLGVKVAESENENIIAGLT